MWYVEDNALWEALRHMLYELQYRVHEEKTRNAWYVINRIYSRHHRESMGQQKTAFSTPIQDLI